MTGHAQVHQHKCVLDRSRLTLKWPYVECLYTPQLGKEPELTQQLSQQLDQYRWDVVGLPEVRWFSFGETITDYGHKLWYSDEDLKHGHHVRFLVRKEVVRAVLSCSLVSC